MKRLTRAQNAAARLADVDLDELDAVSGGRLFVEERPPAAGSFNRIGDWVPGRYNLNLDGMDFGPNDFRSGFGDHNTAEYHANGIAAQFLRDNPDYDSVSYTGALTNGQFIDGNYSRHSLAGDDAAGTFGYADAMRTGLHEQATLGSDPMYQAGVMQTNENLYNDAMGTAYQEQANVASDPMYQAGVMQTGAEQGGDGGSETYDPSADGGDGFAY